VRVCERVCENVSDLNDGSKCRDKRWKLTHRPTHKIVTEEISVKREEK